MTQPSLNSSHMDVKTGLSKKYKVAVIFTTSLCLFVSSTLLVLYIANSAAVLPLNVAAFLSLYSPIVICALIVTISAVASVAAISSYKSNKEHQAESVEKNNNPKSPTASPEMIKPVGTPQEKKIIEVKENTQDITSFINSEIKDRRGDMYLDTSSDVDSSCSMDSSWSGAVSNLGNKSVSIDSGLGDAGEESGSQQSPINKEDAHYQKSPNKPVRILLTQESIRAVELKKVDTAKLLPKADNDSMTIEKMLDRIPNVYKDSNSDKGSRSDDDAWNEQNDFTPQLPRKNAITTNGGGTASGQQKPPEVPEEKALPVGSINVKNHHQPHKGKKNRSNNRGTVPDQKSFGNSANISNEEQTPTKFSTDLTVTSPSKENKKMSSRHNKRGKRWNNNRGIEVC